ncbi:MAG TPA: hypothetical protein VJ732_02965, partial [Bryobacteraceae bacterium]|nr:hypothetical protein [Bryobacteraceae bacterium]
NIELQLGSGFEPVCGRHFDLILANLPFVITPERRYVYRDSGLHLDSFAEQVVREAAAALEEGGYAQILCQWAHLGGQDWQARLSGWLAGSGCDAWILRHYTEPPDVYAEQWIAGTEPGDLETGSRLFQEWMAYYERENVEAISTGMIVLRRRTAGGNWLRIEDLPPKEPDLYGDALERGFALRDFAERRDEELLAIPLRVSPAVRLASESEWSPAGWKVVEARLRKTRGLRYQGNLDSPVLQLLNRCDGTHAPRELLEQMAVSLHVDFERVSGAALPLIRQLIERDVLLPPSLPDQG